MSNEHAADWGAAYKCPEHDPKNGDERIAAFRSIVERGAFATIDGVTIDLTSARIVVEVYDKLNEKNRAHFAAHSAPTMVGLAFKLLNKAGA